DIVPTGVGPGDQRRQVGAHSWGGLEGVPLGGPVVLDGDGGAVGHHLPVRGRGDADVGGGFEVGVVEAREHPLGVGGCELGVEVDLVVDGVDEAVQALTGVGGAAVGVDDADVAPGQPGQRDAAGLVVAGHVDVASVERGAVN